MGKFNDNAITNAGRNLLGDVNIGAVFTPTKIVIGSGYLPPELTSKTITAVVKPEAELTINKKQKANDGTAVIGGVYTNESVQTDFYFRELALYAKAVRADGSETAEVLYSYGNAGDTADLMPAYTVGSPVARQIDIATYVGNDARVNLQVPSGIYMTREEVAQEIADALPNMDFIKLGEKGQPNGVATLDGKGKITSAQMPYTYESLRATYGDTLVETHPDANTTVLLGTIAEGSPVIATKKITDYRDPITSLNDKLTVATTIDGVTKVLTTTAEGTKVS